MINIPKTETNREWMTHPAAQALVSDIRGRQMPNAVDVLVRAALNSQDATVRHAAVEYQNLVEFLRQMKGAATDAGSADSAG